MVIVVVVTFSIIDGTIFSMTIFATVYNYLVSLFAINIFST